MTSLYNTLVHISSTTNNMTRFKWRPVMVLVYLVVMLAALAQTSSLVCCLTNDDDLAAWTEFKQQFNKSYQEPSEEQRRLEIFLDNKRYIESQNLKATPNSFEQGVNHLSDLTTEEIVRTRCGFRLNANAASAHDFLDLPEKQGDDGGGGGGGGTNILATLLNAFNVSQWLDDDSEIEPTSRHHAKYSRAWFENLFSQTELDYRQAGVVSRVKDQGACGSCWAFATTGALESMLAQRGKQVLLSEQNLVDCSKRYGNNGCSGGLMSAALKYVRDRGIMSARDYPYTGQDDQCKFRPNQVVTRVRGSALLPRGNEALLRVALTLTGPIPVAIDAGARSFHSYKSGVYNENSCKSSTRALNHAVLLIGFGTSRSGEDYWLLKNSWGRSWGDNGYIKMARNRRNQCGVATYAVLPIA